MAQSIELLLVIYLLFLSGCSSGTPSIPETENETLNKLLESVPFTQVSLHDVSIDTLFAEEENVLPVKRASSLSPSARLGQVLGLIKVGDSLYVADGQQDCIWIINDQGILHRKIGRKGRGPGEFGDLNGIVKNSNHIFTSDISNGRIQIFDFNFNLQGLFNYIIGGDILTGNKSFTVTDSLLYLSTGVNSTTDKLVTAYKVTPPFDSLTSFHPSLIPPGMQPAAYNNYFIDTNVQGNIAISYLGLPYIFLYDNRQKLRHVVYVEFPEDEIPDNPSPEPVSIPARRESEAIGVRGLMGHLSIAEDKSLYFFGRRELYHILFDADAKEYKPHRAIFFTFGDPEKRKAQPHGIATTSITIEDDTIYLGSIFEERIYRFPLN